MPAIIELSLKCKISAIWLVATAYIFLIFLIATVQISIECEMQENKAEQNIRKQIDCRRRSSKKQTNKKQNIQTEICE